MPKVVTVHFATLDRDKLTTDEDGNLLFHNYDYEQGVLVVKNEEIPELILWLREEYQRFTGMEA